MYICVYMGVCIYIYALIHSPCVCVCRGYMHVFIIWYYMILYMYIIYSVCIHMERESVCVYIYVCVHILIHTCTHYMAYHSIIIQYFVSICMCMHTHCVGEGLARLGWSWLFRVKAVGCHSAWLRTRPHPMAQRRTVAVAILWRHNGHLASIHLALFSMTIDENYTLGTFQIVFQPSLGIHHQSRSCFFDTGWSAELFGYKSCRSSGCFAGGGKGCLKQPEPHFSYPYRHTVFVSGCYPSSPSRTIATCGEHGCWRWYHSIAAEAWLRCVSCGSWQCGWLSHDVTRWSEHDILVRKCMPAGWCKSKMIIGCNWDGNFLPLQILHVGAVQNECFQVCRGLQICLWLLGRSTCWGCASHVLRIILHSWKPNPAISRCSKRSWWNRFLASALGHKLLDKRAETDINKASLSQEPLKDHGPTAAPFPQEPNFNEPEGRATWVPLVSCVKEIVWNWATHVSIYMCVESYGIAMSMASYVEYPDPWSSLRMLVAS